VAWKLEVERVAPKLRVAVAPDMRDWRQHLEAGHTHMATLKAAWPDVRCGQLAMEGHCTYGSSADSTFLRRAVPASHCAVT
jgi:hypothetical protein